MIGLFLSFWAMQVIGMFFIIASHGGEVETVQSMTLRVAVWLAFVNYSLYSRFSREEEKRNEQIRVRGTRGQETKTIQ